eukprot:16433600-Heterocapsa_arctica.AAC.1
MDLGGPSPGTSREGAVRATSFPSPVAGPTQSLLHHTASSPLLAHLATPWGHPLTPRHRLKPGPSHRH